MSHQSSFVAPDPEADAAVTATVRCSFCLHEISEHEDTSPCPHCREYAFPLECER